MLSDLYSDKLQTYNILLGRYHRREEFCAQIHPLIIMFVYQVLCGCLWFPVWFTLILVDAHGVDKVCRTSVYFGANLLCLLLCIS